MKNNPSQAAPELLRAAFRTVVIVGAAFLVGVGLLIYIGVAKNSLH
jgi:hypothetical protein